ncbi:biogenesis of lysosome-related organelles complex 1 subunit 2 isoform X2 [Cryptomeria japonica]|uniref:biogenesis of lysosome-related organelles complex 1 subunit 2 isoform X2 n=1 Tax=Cryptomeria japonica TaxID=3369 RepID=UPI0025AB64EF|nr:biogenesis of lysosome-related organelles complex 1 subunit 2 isoform X2 [Cryptomeria japonica]
MEPDKGKEKEKDKEKALAQALFDLFTNVSSFVQGELQGTNNLLELLEKMNLRTADEYNNFGDIASGLRVFVEQLKTKNENFHEYMQQIDEIDQQVTELEAVVSTLDKYTYTLENKVRSAYVESRPK